jgi:hypothetical protein
MNFPQSGGCQCGAIRYEITGHRWRYMPAIVLNARSNPAPHLPWVR